MDDRWLQRTSLREFSTTESEPHRRVRSRLHGYEKTIQELYRLLVADKKLNEQIVDDVLLAMEECRAGHTESF